jgi:hypothetical protein
MKKLAGLCLCASLLLNAVLLLPPRREPAPEPFVAPSATPAVPKPARLAVRLLPPAMTVKCGAEIPVLWTVLDGRRTAWDWIGLFAPEGRNGDFLAWTYVPAGERGQLTLKAPDRPGPCERRYLVDNGFESVAVSGRVLVVD